MNQIERIKYMEQILDQTSFAIQDLSDSLSVYASLLSKIKELESYYQSSLWLKDFEDDEKNLLPDSLKRGVLSEDALYDLFSNQDELLLYMESLIYTSKNERS